MLGHERLSHPQPIATVVLVTKYSGRNHGHDVTWALGWDALVKASYIVVDTKKIRVTMRLDYVLKVHLGVILCSIANTFGEGMCDYLVRKRFSLIMREIVCFISYEKWVHS